MRKEAPLGKWMNLPHRAGALAVLIAGTSAAIPSRADGVPPAGLPPVVQQYISRLAQICRNAGGTPSDPAAAVKPIDLTQDGVSDYLVNGAAYKCRGADSALADDRQRTPVAIFVTMPQASGGNTISKTVEKPVSKAATKTKEPASGRSVVKAFETMAYGVTLRTDGTYPRLLIQQAAADCAATGPVLQPLDEIKFCARPLDWDAETQRFTLAPPDKVAPAQ